MKKIMLISIVLFFTILNGSKAQFANVNPIPFYNYQMTTPNAGFQEPGQDNKSTEEKRDMQVEITTSSDAMTEIFATVLIVKKNGSQVLGPYTVLAGTTLSVRLPKGKWGAAINCGWAVSVSVWIE